MNERKSTLVAYLLWFFLGSLGGHQFYLGKPIVGMLYFLCTVVGFVTLYFGVGGILLVIVGIGLIVDLFRIPGFIQKDMSKKREELFAKYRMTGNI